VSAFGSMCAGERGYTRVTTTTSTTTTTTTTAATYLRHALRRAELKVRGVRSCPCALEPRQVLVMNSRRSEEVLPVLRGLLPREGQIFPAHTQLEERGPEGEAHQTPH
jgi:hypothetical protein